MRKWLIAFTAALLLCGCASPTAQTEPSIETTVSPVTSPAAVVPADGEIPFFAADQVRVDYSGQEQWVRYITAPEQLPEEPALEEFDASFFRDYALVLVKITLSSGSILPELEHIRCADGCAVVSVRRTAPGGDMTDDMAAWLLWACVDRNLACLWTLEGDAQIPAGEKY